MRYVVYLIPTGNVPERVVDRACPHHLCVCLVLAECGCCGIAIDQIPRRAKLVIIIYWIVVVEKTG